MPSGTGGGKLKTIYLVKPRGFCAGVVRAIEVVERTLEMTGPPIYVRKEIVHNGHVVEELRQRGAIFVESLAEVPVGAVAIFSAHGVSPAVREEARTRRLRVIDATCPLVTKVHLEAIRYARQGYSIILIGRREHDEVEGTMGEAPDWIQIVTTVEEASTVTVVNPEHVVYLTQTTLSLYDTAKIVARLRQRFPAIIAPPADDICYATQNRQEAVERLAGMTDLILVVGAFNSSNSNRLVEVAREAGARAHLIEDFRGIREEWLAAVNDVGVTAGASTPEVLVSEVVDSLGRRGFQHIQEVEIFSEDVHFVLPPELHVLPAH